MSEQIFYRNYSLGAAVKTVNRNAELTSMKNGAREKRGRLLVLVDVLPPSLLKEFQWCFLQVEMNLFSLSYTHSRTSVHSKYEIFLPAVFHELQNNLSYFEDFLCPDS